MPNTSPESWDAPRHARMAAGLQLLIDAANDANTLGLGLWQHAVRVRSLREEGVKEPDLLLMIGLKLVEHKVEKENSHREKRTFALAGNHCIEDKSCFVITDEGRKFARRLTAKMNQETEPPAVKPKAKPVWNKNDMQLYWKGQAVLLLIRDTNHKKVVVAFHAANWQIDIENPLKTSDQLREALRKLNDKLRDTTLRFRRDGTKHGVIWYEVN